MTMLPTGPDCVPANVRPERTLLEMSLWFGCLVGVVLYAADQRLPTGVYCAAAVCQFLAVYVHLCAARFLTAVFGAAFTAVLFLGTLIEWTPSPNFNPTLTEAVYLPEVISRAYNVLLFSCSLYHALALRYVPAEPWQWSAGDLSETYAARKLHFLGLIVTPVLLMVSSAGSLITDSQYASVSFNEAASSFRSSGLAALGLFCVVMTVVAAARLHGITSFRFRMTAAYCSALVFYFLLMRGSRSGALVFFASLALLFFKNSRRPGWHKVLILGSFTLSLFCLYETWGFVRANASEVGFYNSLVEGWTATVYDDFIDSASFQPLDVTLIPQSYWHLLHCVDLYDTGFGLEGETVFGLIPQAVPGFIADSIGFERPLNAAWRLGEYRISGGGMFIIAEGYWNFGMLGAGLVAASMAAVAIGFERYFERRSPLLSAAYFGYMGSFGYSIYYGLQPNVRMLEMAVAVAFLLGATVKAYRIALHSGQTPTLLSGTVVAARSGD